MNRPRDPAGGSIGYLLWQVALRWRLAADRELAPLGLTHARYMVLATLYGLARAGVQPSQRELADASGLEPMYVSRLARALTDAGLVARATHPADPRAVVLALTPRGEELALEAITRVRGLQERLLAPLGGAAGERTRTLRASLEVLFHSAPAGGSVDQDSLEEGE